MTTGATLLTTGLLSVVAGLVLVVAGERIWNFNEKATSATLEKLGSSSTQKTPWSKSPARFATRFIILPVGVVLTVVGGVMLAQGS